MRQQDLPHVPALQHPEGHDQGRYTSSGLHGAQTRIKVKNPTSPYPDIFCLIAESVNTVKLGLTNSVTKKNIFQNLVGYNYFHQKRVLKSGKILLSQTEAKNAK